LKFYKYVINNKVIAILTELEFGKYKILKKYTDIQDFSHAVTNGYMIHYNKNTQTLYSIRSNRIQPLDIEDITPEIKLDLL
jgi:hypothetical protein